MPTKHQGSPAEVRALNAYICLMRASASVTDRTSPPMRDAGLTPSQFGALEALLHGGSMKQNELAKKLLKTDGNIVMVVRNLEKRGLVERKESEADRRAIVVSLSAAGRALARRVYPKVLEEIVRNFGVLSPVDQDALRASCRRLGRGKE